MKKSQLQFSFADETGVALDVHQPYFGVGALFIPDTITLNRTLHDVYYKALEHYRRPRGAFELKFSMITRGNLRFFQDALTALTKTAGWEFIGTLESKHKWQPETYWTRYLSHLDVILQQAGRSNSVLVADFLSKPHVAKNDINTLIGKRGVRQVLQLESEGSLLLQVADILLGSLNFLKRTAGVADQKKTAKAVIAEQVESLKLEKLDKKKDGYTVTVYRLYSPNIPL